MNSRELISLSASSLRQHGSVLIVSLVFLLILTIIGLSSIQGSTLQERMAGNSRDVNNAFQAAEIGIREAEVILQQANLPNFNGANGLYQLCNDVDSTTASCIPPDWSVANSTGWSAVTGVSKVSAQPQFYIQKYLSVMDPQGDLSADAPPKKLDIYKVVSRGFGVSDTAMVALEATYRRD